MKLDLDVIKHSGTADTTALVDSGATENFIDYQEVLQLRLGTQNLPRPLVAYNADNTKNKGGRITKSIYLYITQGNLKKRMKFLISNLGSNCLILGYPWLREFNPNLDWKEARIIGSKIRIYTTKPEMDKEREEHYVRAF